MFPQCSCSFLFADERGGASPRWLWGADPGERQTSLSLPLRIPTLYHSLNELILLRIRHNKDIRRPGQCNVQKPLLQVRIRPGIRLHAENSWTLIRYEIFSYPLPVRAIVNAASGRVPLSGIGWSYAN